jgi:hypothetical protein
VASRYGLFSQVIDKIVEEYGDAEVKRKLLGADVRLTQGTARVLLKMPARERKKAVDELVEKGELQRAKKGKAAPGRRPDRSQGRRCHLLTMLSFAVRSVVLGTESISTDRATHWRFHGHPHHVRHH